MRVTIRNVAAFVGVIVTSFVGSVGQSQGASRPIALAAFGGDKVVVLRFDDAHWNTHEIATGERTLLTPLRAVGTDIVAFSQPALPDVDGGSLVRLDITSGDLQVVKKLEHAEYVAASASGYWILKKHRLVALDERLRESGEGAIDAPRMAPVVVGAQVAVISLRGVHLFDRRAQLVWSINEPFVLGVAPTDTGFLLARADATTEQALAAHGQPGLLQYDKVLIDEYVGEKIVRTITAATSAFGGMVAEQNAGVVMLSSVSGREKLLTIPRGSHSPSISTPVPLGSYSIYLLKNNCVAVPSVGSHRGDTSISIFNHHLNLIATSPQGVPVSWILELP